MTSFVIALATCDRSKPRMVADIAQNSAYDSVNYGAVVGVAAGGIT